MKGFEAAVEASHRALDEIARGSLDAFMDLYTDRDDATVGNPYGPPARGRDEIEHAGRRAAASYRVGRAVGFENVATYVSGALRYHRHADPITTLRPGESVIQR